MPPWMFLFYYWLLSVLDEGGRQDQMSPSYKGWRGRSMRCSIGLLSDVTALIYMVLCQDDAGNTPLHTAIHVSCHHAIDQITSQQHVDYRVVNNDELNVLHLAVVKGDMRSVSLQHTPKSHESAAVYIHLFIMNSYRKYTYRPSLYKYMQ